MLISAQTNDVTVYPGDINFLMDYVGVLDPSQQDIIQQLANSASITVEKYLGAPIGKRSIRVVLARGESELNGWLNRSWLSNTYSFGGINGINTNDWIELPTKIDSIQNVMINDWDGNTYDLILGTNYQVDMFSNPGRLNLSWQLQILDTIYKYANTVVDYTGGIFEVDGTVPEPIMSAINYTVKNMYENRGDGNNPMLTDGFKMLLAPYKNPAIGWRT